METMFALVLCYVGSLLRVGQVGAAYFAVTGLTVSLNSVSPARWNCKGACKACGEKTSLFGRLARGRNVAGRLTDLVVTKDGRGFLYENGRVTVPCRGCGRARYATKLAGKFRADKICNAKCEGACGPTCECSCGGKNHGAAVSL